MDDLSMSRLRMRKSKSQILDAIESRGNAAEGLNNRLRLQKDHRRHQNRKILEPPDLEKIEGVNFFVNL